MKKTEEKFEGRPKTTVGSKSLFVIRKILKTQLSDENLQRYTKLKAILELTNATPIKKKLGRGYYCDYCPDIYRDPRDLKKHVFRDHFDIRTGFEFLKEMMSYGIVKLDITDFECSLCLVEMDSLTEMCNHLRDRHGKVLYIDNLDRFVCFKFDNPDIVKCTICSESYVSFHLLLQHMNIHYRNYICEECQTGFVSKASLTNHTRTSHRFGTFKCRSCHKVFDNMNKMRDHEKIVHEGFKKNSCPHCRERFAGHEQRRDHLVQVHGERLAYKKCNECDKSFESLKKLNRHIKKYHLMERRHKCEQCDMSFFTKTQLDMHQLKHTDERPYECNICYKSYRRKTTLREHLKSHNYGRRLTCENCLQTFVQKCSWRAHMKNKHDILV